MRNRIRYHDQVRTNQETEELRIICNEESNQVRRLQTEGLSLRQEKDPNTVSQLLKQVRELQDQVGSHSQRKKTFTILTQRSSGVSHLPSQPVVVPSSGEALGRDSGLPAMTRHTTGNAGNVSGKPTCSRRFFLSYLQKFENSDFFVLWCST